MIRIVDHKTGIELATMGTFAIDTTALTDVTNFGAPAQTWIATRDDVTMTVEKFQTPQQDPWELDNRIIAERAKTKATEESLAESINLIAALVRACGGSVTLSADELLHMSGKQLLSETTPDGRLILRLRDA